MTKITTETVRKTFSKLWSETGKYIFRSLIYINKCSSKPSQPFHCFRREHPWQSMGVGSVWGGDMWGGGHIHAVTHRDTGKAVMNVWIWRGSPYSPAFVVTVKSSHSASDWEWPAQQCLYYAGDSYMCMSQCTPGKEIRQQHTHSIDISVLPTCFGINRRGYEIALKQKVSLI